MARSFDSRACSPRAEPRCEAGPRPTVRGRGAPRTRVTRPVPQALTIATSDSGGGAGVQADLKSIEANGAYALSVLVAVTAQNTKTVTMIHALPREVIEAQLEAVFDDFTIGAVKTGMLLSAEIVGTVAAALKRRRAANLVVDPVMISKSGHVLLKPDAVARMTRDLFPLATLVTPNIHEAQQLADLSIGSLEEAEEAARRILRFGCRAVLIKGGHLAAAPATDLLYDGRRTVVLRGEWIDTPHTHGTGCTYSASITAQLAKGRPMPAAVRTAKRYVTEAIRHGLPIGHGHGPTRHFYHLPADPV
ncbi:MAG TPA: bifunctional hydroxymethylpyrimidine kinase/phosphomethylpyrimidine kinase [Nitrospiria bacterium]|nr:bifunctional hydroxymethylpyrimidine kinase/phosphomethylpyrimidine kinase [Nitrospiria bacterium]